MNDDKSKRLQLTLWDVQKRWGQKALGVLNNPVECRGFDGYPNRVFWFRCPIGQWRYSAWAHHPDDRHSDIRHDDPRA